MRTIRSVCFFIFLLAVFSGAVSYGDVDIPPSPVQLVHKSREQMGSGDLREALRYAREAVAADPAYPEAWKQLGRVLLLTGNYSEALTSLRTLLEIRKDDTQAREWIIRSLFALGRTKEVVLDLEKMPDSMRSRLGSRFITSVLEQLLDESDFDNAEAVALLCRKSASEAGEQKALAALIKIIKNNPEEARDILASAGAPNNARPLLSLAWTRLGIVLLESDEVDQAVASLKKALELEPGSINALRQLGWAYIRARRPEQAADIWEKGVEKEPRLASWYEWIADARIEAGQMKEAEDADDRLLKSEPSNRQGRILKLAILLLRKENTAASYEARLANMPEGARLVSLAYVLADRHSGRFKEAAARLEDLLRLSPDDPEIRKSLANVYAEWAAHVRGRETLEPLQKLVSLEPDNPAALRDLGWGLWENKKQSEAIEAWDHAITKGVKNRERLIMQVVAYLSEQGFGTQARELFTKWEPDSSLLSFGLKLVKAKRYVAAREILAAAWERKEKETVTGLYLAYSEARTGICTPVPGHLAPFLEKDIRDAGKDEADVFVSTIDLCNFDPAMLALLIKLETLLDKLPEHRVRIVDILEKAAIERQNVYDYEDALKLYHLALRHDSNRPAMWIKAFRAAKSLGRNQEATELLEYVLANSSAPSVLAGVRGKLSDEKGERSTAVGHYRDSLEAEPNQPDVRLLLFEDLMSLHRFEEANRETDWFVKRLESGDLDVRSHLAEMYTDLGDMEKALDLWQKLYLTFPDTPSFALETANALYRLCRAAEAVTILERLLSLRPYPRAYELLAEIHMTMDRPADALEWATKGLAAEKTRNLLRIQAEAADILGKPDIALQAAEALLESDPGDSLMARIAGRALVDKKLMEKGNTYYNGLLARNPFFEPGLRYLRTINSSEGRPKEALQYADRLVKQRPWDTDAQLDHALSLAEAGKWPESLHFLRGNARQETFKAFPVLVYDNVTRCPYPGRNTAKQTVSHVERLAREGYELTTPAAATNVRTKPQVIVVVGDADADSLLQIDAALQHTGGKAVCAFTSDNLSNQAPGNPSVKMLSYLQSTGRWTIASKGLQKDMIVPVDDSGRHGNLLTHKLNTSKVREQIPDMASRLDHFLGESASSDGIRAQIFLYPEGDYGQLSLDVDSRDLETLGDAVKRNFIFAIASDAHGFIGYSFDPLRLPGRYVPPGWDDEELMDHLTTDNPLVRSKLDLAKVLYLQGQHERANEWFAKAEAAGADSEELNFHWGSNAYEEGDLPVALEKLRDASDMNPESLRNKRSLERAENSKRPRLELTSDNWNDSDKRKYSSWGGDVRSSLSDNLYFNVFAERDRWSRRSVGAEDGTRFGAGLRWFFAGERWLDMKLWYMDLDHVDDHVGGFAGVHLPFALLGGYVDLQAAREEIDTVEAVRAKILANRFAVQTYSRVHDMWDLFANMTFTDRSDDNKTIMLDGIFMRRFHEWPFLGLGYRFAFADSDRNPPEYWAPKGLQQHQLYATARGEYGLLHYSLSAQAGPSEEKSSGWRFVWGVHSDLDFRLSTKLLFYGKYIRQETPTYRSNEWLLGIRFIF